MERQEILGYREEEESAGDRYLTFWADQQLFGLSIADVVQIVGIQHITRLPGVPAYVRGVISLRSDVIPVMDVRVRLEREEKEYNDRTCIIIAKIFESLFGFIVDAVDEVCEIPQGRITLPSHINAELSGGYLTGIARVESGQNKEEKVILIIDIKKLMSEEEFTKLSQAGK
ncbi:MAG: chemotaxis protein CheW [Lachnospiraceae bacterium]